MKSQISYDPRCDKKKPAKFPDSYLITNLARSIPIIKLQFEPWNLLLSGLQVFWGQWYFCVLILKVSTSRLRSLNLLPQNFKLSTLFPAANSQPSKTPKHLKFWHFERGNVIVKPGINSFSDFSSALRANAQPKLWYWITPPTFWKRKQQASASDQIIKRNV